MDLVRAAGGRVTDTRRAVIAAVVAADHHVSAEDVADAVRAVLPSVHRSTIYRTLDALEKLGVVDHVHLGHGRAIYHLADETHQHLVCETCGAVVEVPESLLDGLRERVRRDYAFALTSHHFALFGRCAACTT